MALQRFKLSRTGVAVLVATVAAATAIGGGIAAASQPQKAAKAAAAPGARVCGAPKTTTFSGVTVTVRTCLQMWPSTDGTASWWSIQGSSEVTVAAAAGVVTSCKVRGEGPLKKPVKPQTAGHDWGCLDFIGKGATRYDLSWDMTQANTGWARTTVEVVTASGAMRAIPVEYTAVLELPSK
jgi:hypothetical protein